MFAAVHRKVGFNEQISVVVAVRKPFDFKNTHFISVRRMNVKNIENKSATAAIKRNLSEEIVSYIGKICKLFERV